MIWETKQCMNFQLIVGLLLMKMMARSRGIFWLGAASPQVRMKYGGNLFIMIQLSPLIPASFAVYLVIHSHQQSAFSLQLAKERDH